MIEECSAQTNDWGTYHTPLNAFPFVAPLQFRIFCQHNGAETVPNRAFYVKKMFVARFGALYRPEIM
jgi:hypothetical protein